MQKSPTLQRRESRGGPTPTQALLGWLALGLVLATTLVAGATSPRAWIFLCTATLALFAVQVALDVAHGVPDGARAALRVGLLYFAVVAWLQVQCMPGLLPGMAHPAWSLAPDGAKPTISVDPDSGRQVVMRLTCYALLFWIFLRSFASDRRAGHMIAVLALFSTALALYGFAVKATGTNLLLGLDDSQMSLRASFVNRNNFATFAVFGVLANVTAFYNVVHKRIGSDGTGGPRHVDVRVGAERWLYAVGALVGLAAIVASGSRAGAAAGLVGLLVLAWALVWAHGKSGWIFLAGLGAVVGSAMLAMTNSRVGRLVGVDEDIRVLIFPRVIEGVLDRPLLGHGAGGFKDAFHAYISLQGAEIEFQYAHNSYLENAFEFGLPAAVLFFGALGLIAWRLMRAVLSRRVDQSAPALALACFAAAAFHAAFDGSLQIPAIAAVFAGILGVGWGLIDPVHRTHEAGQAADIP